MKILTPVLRVLSFTKLRFKSLKFPATAIQKAHPAVRIPPFSVLFQSALPLIISNSTNKNKDRTFSTMTTVCQPSAFETGKNICFQTATQNTVLCQPIKFCLRFFLSAFKIIGDSDCWMRAENSGIQTDGCAFPGKVGWESGDFGMAVVKLKTGNPALRFTMELSARNASFHCESCF